MYRRFELINTFKRACFINSSPFFSKLADMKVLFLTEALIFSVIPRSYPLITDTITLSLRNEMTDETITPAITFTVTDKLNITITAQPADFKTQNKYEVNIKNGTDIIYLGKMIILESGTDVQNYENSTQTNEKFGYK